MPGACAGCKFVDDKRPVVEGRGIEVRSIGPDKRVNLWIQPDVSEQVGILQRSIQLASQHRSKIDGLLRAIRELDPQSMDAYSLEGGDPMEGVLDAHVLL